MSKHNQYYRDTNFDAAQNVGCTLLVQLNAASFTYAVICGNKLVAFEENLAISELSHPSVENQLLSTDYKQRVTGLPNTGFTFVPVSLFKPDLVTDFARFLDVKANEQVFSQLLDTENQVVFKVDEAVAGKLVTAESVFGAKGWIKAIAADDLPDETLYLNIDNGKVEILNFKDSKLRFYNSFEFRNPDELVYFTSLVTEELQLTTSGTTLILSGDVEQGDNNSKRLAEFFGSVKFNDLKVVELPEQIAAHTVLSLTALSLCGSSEEL